ncbi:MAG: hypothetical protein R3C29_03130 [Dehalococcoidia bacterium]
MISTLASSESPIVSLIVAVLLTVRTLTPFGVDEVVRAAVRFGRREQRYLGGSGAVHVVVPFIVVNVIDGDAVRFAEVVVAKGERDVSGARVAERGVSGQ